MCFFQKHPWEILPIGYTKSFIPIERLDGGEIMYQRLDVGEIVHQSFVQEERNLQRKITIFDFS